MVNTRKIFTYVALQKIGETPGKYLFLLHGSVNALPLMARTSLSFIKSRKGLSSKEPVNGSKRSVITLASIYAPIIIEYPAANSKQYRRRWEPMAASQGRSGCASLPALLRSCRKDPKGLREKAPSVIRPSSPGGNRCRCSESRASCSRGPPTGSASRRSPNCRPDSPGMSLKKVPWGL